MVSKGKDLKEHIVSQFVDKQTISALTTFIDSDDISDCAKQTDLIAKALGSDGSFLSPEQNEKKLVASFKNNLILLIQKTWVDKSDLELKERVLYRIDQFCNADNLVWKESYGPFIEMIYDAVFLMFGQQPRSVDFVEWAFRIDPDFGIFWWYISSLPHTNIWAESKCRVAIMLGMYFMAKY